MKSEKKGFLLMALRKLTPDEIEIMISENKIVWVTCRTPSIPLLQGKFMRGKSPINKETDEYPYSFCPFKRGIKTGFLPASSWLIDDEKVNQGHDEIISDVLKKAFKR